MQHDHFQRRCRKSCTARKCLLQIVEQKSLRIISTRDASAREQIAQRIGETARRFCGYVLDHFLHARDVRRRAAGKISSSSPSDAIATPT